MPSSTMARLIVYERFIKLEDLNLSIVGWDLRLEEKDTGWGLPESYLI
jgi:hypothetical protein